MFVISKCFDSGSFFKVLRCCYFRCISNNTEDRLKTRAIRLAELLDCSVETASIMISKNIKILALDDHDVEKSTLFCKNNLRLSDVLENPIILTLPRHHLSQRMFTLKELGYDYDVYNILRFRTIMFKNPKLLKKEGILPYTEDFLLKELSNCKPEEVSKISKKLSHMYLENCPLHAIKTELNAQYLAIQLKVPKEKIDKLRKKKSTLFLQSIENINNSLNVLTGKYGISITKISHNPALLALPSEHLENLLENMPTILGVPFHTLVKSNPRFLEKSVFVLKRMESVLKDFGVTGRQLASCSMVLSLSVPTLRKRLQLIHNSEDLSLFKHFRYFLGLVKHKHVHARLKQLKESKIPYSLSVFYLSEKEFKKRLLLSKGLNYANDIIQYLSELYNINGKALRKHLSKIPNFYCTSVLDACKVINFLLSRNVSKEQLWNGLGIITYDPNIVEEIFDQLPYYKEFQPFSEWEGHFNLIQLLIYAIEKNRNHFSDIDKLQIDFFPYENHNDTIKTENSSDIFQDHEAHYDSDSEVDNETDSDDDMEDKRISDAYKL